MSSSAALATGYLLIDPPGVIRATTLTGDFARAGGKVDAALGVRWADLLHVAEGAGEVVTPHGAFRIERLRGERGEVVALLLVQGEAPRTSTTRPPASAPRVSLGIEVVAGRDPAARASVDLALRLGKTMLPIYVACEEGAGADVVARVIGEMSGRGDHPFVHVRAGTPSEEPITDRLFGADALSVGGTLYVEDVEDLDVETGKRLAREIDRGVLADTHFVASGPDDLRERVTRGTFARELFTLVRTSTVTLPPLRDREDFEHVVRLTLDHVGGAAGRGVRFEIAPETMRMLKAHAWPGNLRELASWLERAVASAAPERLLRPEHFPFEATEAQKAESGAAHGLRHVAERSALEEALRSSGGNASLAAKKLGVARSTLYRMMQRHKIER